MSSSELAPHPAPTARPPSWRAPVAVLACLCLLLGGCATAAVGTGAAAGTAAFQERGFKTTLDDQGIRLEVNHLWFQDHYSLYGGIHMQVQEGRVLLTGTVPDPETRVKAVRLAWQAKGVREVINEIEIDDESSLTDSARDTWITTKLRARILADREIDAINYSIETVNQSIFLMGIAHSQAELDRVIRHAKDISYVRRVVSYVRVKDGPGSAS